MHHRLQVTIHDEKCATSWDLGAQYYLSEADLGKNPLDRNGDGENRAEASRAALAELNDSVTLRCETAKLRPELVAQHDLTVLTDAPFDYASQVCPSFLFHPHSLLAPSKTIIRTLAQSGEPMGA